MGFYIYKYVQNGEISYIGKTIDLEKRIEQHKRDKLSNFQGKIYYFECPNKTAMNSWEYCLINKYHPKYNIALKNNDTNINIVEPEWNLYMDIVKQQPKSNIINLNDYKKKIEHQDSDNQHKTVIINSKPMTRFTCRHCYTTFETTDWSLTKGRHYSAICPSCHYAAWAR